MVSMLNNYQVFKKDPSQPFIDILTLAFPYLGLVLPFFLFALEEQCPWDGSMELKRPIVLDTLRLNIAAGLFISYYLKQV